MKKHFTRNKLKKVKVLKWAVLLFRLLKRPRGIVRILKEFIGFRKDWSAYQKLGNNPAFSLETTDLYPRLFDKTDTTHVDPVYFYQNSWCVKKIFEADRDQNNQHVDVGSDVKMLGIMSQYIPTTMVDIRPIEISLPGLSFMKGDIQNLPFRDGEIRSLSSICVIEHIGLGRYGDKLDPYGSEKAAKELIRVLAIDGSLYISLPVDSHNRVYFNAHRAFTREYTLRMFSPLEKIEEQYIYGNKMFDSYDPDKGFGTGLFHFKKTQKWKKNG